MRAEGIEVLVVDVRSAIQALPALAVHEPAAGFGADAAAMGRAAARMRHAAIAAGRSGPDAAAAEAAVLAATDELLAGARGASSGAELVTFLAGEDTPAGLAELAAARVHAARPDAEVECHVGAPPGILLLAGAE